MGLSITLVIVIITCLVSIGGFSNQKMIDDLIFYPPSIKRGQFYRFITHGFIHADAAHLAFNMLALYSFGQLLETQVFTYDCFFGSMGKLYFLMLYFFALVFASLPDYFRYKDSYHFRSLGASGAVSAVVFSSIILLPKSGVGILFIPVQIPGYIFAILYLGISYYLDKRGGGRINHGAHLWGAIFGIGFTILMVYLFAHVDVFENFKEQLRATRPFLPYCDL